LESKKKEKQDNLKGELGTDKLDLLNQKLDSFKLLFRKQTQDYNDRFLAIEQIF